MGKILWAEKDNTLFGYAEQDSVMLRLMYCPPTISSAGMLYAYPCDENDEHTMVYPDDMPTVLGVHMTTDLDEIVISQFLVLCFRFYNRIEVQCNA